MEFMMPEITQEEKKALLKRLIRIRTDLLRDYPFFGRLAMQMSLGVARCETAFTDMRRIVFDPAFAAQLNDEQITFVFFHEIMHCVLKHCIRGSNCNALIYNCACDIVVNSNIMKAMNLPHTFEIAGEVPMHLTPDLEEGYLYDAEEVYAMLMKELSQDPAQDGAQGQPKNSSSSKSKSKNSNSQKNNSKNSNSKKNERSNAGELYDNQHDELCGKTVDCHDFWDRDVDPDDPSLSDQWDQKMKETAHMPGCSGTGMPAVQRILQEFEMQSQVGWKARLKEFVKYTKEEYDYNFMPPDRRFDTSDYIMPGYNVELSEQIEKLWFCVDTSGSITMEQINIIMAEIRNAIREVENLKGWISFFTTEVTKPEPFHNLEEFNQIEVKGNGGTNFHCIFQYMNEKLTEEKRPCAVIIMTDGYAAFPQESMADGVPVLWIIVNSEMEPPWGECVHVDC